MELCARFGASATLQQFSAEHRVFSLADLKFLRGQFQQARLKVRQRVSPSIHGKLVA
jgi:hypothetical protein